MPRFAVSVTLLATFEIDAADMASAIREARRFGEEGCDPSGGFVDGWNSVCRAEPGRPTIHDVSGFDVETITADDVEEIDEGCAIDSEE